ncbi:hypothetical protein [Rubritalea sp.]|uniref:hypothetical protein n=1 Tax=Rubritalea sp. TaxID=2109375 RepID=UPI003EF347CF
MSEQNEVLSVDGYVKVINDEGEEYDFLPMREWLKKDIGLLAQNIAENEHRDSGGELSDASAWPRSYKIQCQGGWKEVKVTLGWIPHFAVELVD